jgi:hypothetical protein
MARPVLARGLHMRIATISDIHGNKEALEQIWADIKKTMLMTSSVWVIISVTDRIRSTSFRRSAAKISRQFWATMNWP